MLLNNTENALNATDFNILRQLTFCYINFTYTEKNLLKKKERIDFAIYHTVIKDIIKNKVNDRMAIKCTSLIK